MPEIILNNLTLILPELVLTATALLIIVAHLLRRTDGSIVYYIALAGLVGTVYALTGKTGQNMSAFDGMLSIDPFSLYFKIIIVLSTMVVTIMSRYSAEVKSEPHLTGEYFFLILSMAVGMMFMVGSSNLLMMYLTLEMTSLTSYIASGFTRTAKDSSEASLKYLLYGAFSSGVMLYGMSILYGLTGTLNISGINQVLMQGSVNSLALVVSSLFIMVGFGYKISAVPFHYWTPDVYEGAPVTITAFLSVASKAAGFAMMMRAIKVMFIDSSMLTLPAGSWSFVEGIPLQEVLIILSVATMTLGNLVALWQDNVKRLLAYSSIAQAGYMLLGVLVLGNDGTAAVMVYFVVYLFMNLGAFYVVMLIANKTGSEHIDDYKGLGKKAPLLSVAMAVFLVSLTGLPPTAGFIGKWMIFLSLINAKMIAIAIIGVLNSVVSLYYYVRVIRNLFLRDEDKATEGTFKFPLAQQVLLYSLLIPTLYFGLFFNELVEFAQYSITMFGLK